MYLLAELLLGVLAAAGHGEGLTIDTTSGPVTGFINDTFPNVAQFLGIPFAEQPVGELRWLPPKPKPREAGINATSFSHNCPQYMTNASNIWSVDVPEFNIPPDNDGEDCLTVNVWAPKEECSSHGSLPVFAWIYGGGFDSGGQNVPYQIPTSWIERTQKHIVVSVGYRANIFGFPNAAGLKDDEQNLGLLDQRLGVEWIRSNIANFGGDPNRITLWGHSAGSISVDFYNFAYPEDPIINGLIMGSGSALLPIDTTPNNHSNFTFVANHFGCGNVTAEAEVDCLRKVSWQEIIAFLEDRGNTNTVPALAFHPHTDGRTVFANYTERALAGNFTKKPAISGTTANEGSGFGPYNQTYGPNQTVADYYTLYSFGCPAVMTARTRYAANATTFDYLYDGNFSNISPQWWEGAFHASELPLIFGTSGDYRGASTPAELALSEKMQDYWLAFAEDPVNGLPALGWDAYRPGGDAVLLGYEDVASQPIAEARLAAPCDGFTPNGKPPPP